MDLIKKYKGGILYLMLLALVVVTGCKVSYKLTGASIDYTKIKTISLETFQNRAAYLRHPPGNRSLYPPLH